MRRHLWLVAAAAILALPSVALCQQQDGQPQQDGQSSASQAQSQAPAQSQSGSQADQAQSGQDDSLAAAARRAREQKKESAKAAKVIDNDNIPTRGGVSTVGGSSEGASGEAAAGGAASSASGGGAAGPKDEKYWREKFASLRHKLEQDQAALDVQQRELAQLDIQYYPDPTQAMQQQLTRSDINDKTAKIDATKKQIQADEQAISDAEEELRRSGGDIGWSR